MGAKASSQGQEATPQQQTGGPVSNSPSTISADQGSVFAGETSSGISPSNGIIHLLQQSRSSSASDPCIDPRGRTRRYASFSDAQPITIHTSNNTSSNIAGRTNSTSVATGVSAARYFDSDSSPEESPFLANIFQRHGASSQSLPIHLMNLNGLKCPICSKQIAREEIEFHLVLCLTKPRVSYNEDVVVTESGECVICFEDMVPGDTIARLPCLCIYHKDCIDDWFKRSRTCPEHPPTD